MEIWMSPHVKHLHLILQSFQWDHDCYSPQKTDQRTQKKKYGYKASHFTLENITTQHMDYVMLRNRTKDTLNQTNHHSSVSVSHSIHQSLLHILCVRNIRIFAQNSNIHSNPKSYISQ